jgi:hypothetical protein
MCSESSFRAISEGPEPDEDKKDATPLPPAVTGLRIRDLPNGKIIGILPQGRN